MPGGLVGYLTKLVVIEMIFAPLEFRGVGPVGWQGSSPGAPPRRR